MKKLLFIFLFALPLFLPAQDTLEVSGVSLEGTIVGNTFTGIIIGEGLIEITRDTTLHRDTLNHHASLSIHHEALSNLNWFHQATTDTTDSTWALIVKVNSISDSLRFEYFMRDSVEKSTIISPAGAVSDTLWTTHDREIQVHVKAFADRKIYFEPFVFYPQLIDSLWQ